MGIKRHSEPRPLQLSKRANVFYLEHARVVQQDDRIVYLTQDGGEFEQMFNIPERNTAFLLLGKGTSITDAAMRRMAASNVMVCFCGTGGSPLFSVCDIAFMTPQSEYRPTEYMQAWAEMWFDPARRLEKARSFLRRRAQMTAECWRENSYLQKMGIVLSDAVLERFHSDLEQAKDVQELLLAEARWAKHLYADLARGHGFSFVREEGARRSTSKADENPTAFWIMATISRMGMPLWRFVVLGSVSPCPSCTGRREEARWYLTSRMWSRMVMSCLWPSSVPKKERHKKISSNALSSTAKRKMFWTFFLTS